MFNDNDLHCQFISDRGQVRVTRVRVTISDTLNNPSTQARQALTLLTSLTLGIAHTSMALHSLNREGATDERTPQCLTVFLISLVVYLWETRGLVQESENTKEALILETEICPSVQDSNSFGTSYGFML